LILKQVELSVASLMKAALLLAAALSMTHAHALSYSAKPISAVVVDAGSKQPLEGVVVLVVWSLQDTNGGGGPFWHFEETVTDRNGHFLLPGWGPKAVPAKVFELSQRLGPEQPRLYLFLPGYAFLEIGNEYESWMLGNPAWTGDLVRSSRWSGKIIEMKRFEGSRADYLGSIANVTSELPLQACRWATIPRLTATLIKVRGSDEGFRRSMSFPSLRALEESAADTPGCPAPRQVLEPYLK